jgi:hypothetical protein
LRKIYATPPPSFKNAYIPLKYLLKVVGQNRTNIFLKCKVKLGKIWSKLGIKDGGSCPKL